MYNVMYKMLVTGVSISDYYAIETKIVELQDLKSAVGWYYKTDVLDPETGELLGCKNHRVLYKDLKLFTKHEVKNFTVFLTEDDEIDQCHWKSEIELKVAFIREMLGEDIEIERATLPTLYLQAIKEYEILQ